MRGKRKPTRLRDMNPEMALAHCVNLTVAEWSGIGNDKVVELWRVFRAYILNGFQDSGGTVPAGIADVWNRCKIIIDGEAGQ